MATIAWALTDDTGKQLTDDRFEDWQEAKAAAVKLAVTAPVYIASVGTVSGMEAMVLPAGEL